MVDLSRDDILGCMDMRIEKMHIPEWNGDVYIRQMSAADQDKWERESIKQGGAANISNMRAKLVADVLVNSKGKKLFSEEDIKDLSQKCGAVLNRIIDKANELNRISEKDLEELAKNSQPAP